MSALSVNGEAMEVEDGCTVAAALARWGYDSCEVAVAVNGAFVPRSTWTAQTLMDGDAVDVLGPVQGG